MAQNLTLKVARLDSDKGPLGNFDEYSRENIGQKTLQFVQRLMHDPATRELIRQRAALMKGGAV